MKKFDELMNVSTQIQNISVDEAKEKLNDPNVQFIDVRDKNSFESETIGNAVNLERGLLEFYLRQAGRWADRERERESFAAVQQACLIRGVGSYALTGWWAKLATMRLRLDSRSWRGWGPTKG